MHVGLVIPTNLFFAPYHKIYTNILDEEKIKYDVIFWDRESIGEDNGIVYNYKSPKKSSKLRKIIDYYLFSRFVKKKLKLNKYDKVIIFGPQIGLFIYRFLKKNYFNNFILDYRDLSIEQRLPNLFKKLLNISSLICISSPGFLKCLPCGYNYIISHNFDIIKVREVLQLDQVVIKNLFKNKKITISTIGGIRDYSQNEELINSFKNEKNFILKFIGKGIAEDDLKIFTENNKIFNVEFLGFYNKIEEPNFYENTDLINIYYPKIISHATALSNRFYNGLIFKRPMLVTKDSIQGEFIEKYNLGLSINDCSNLNYQLNNFIKIFDHEIFIKNCNHLLNCFEKDYEKFEIELIKYLKS